MVSNKCDKMVKNERLPASIITPTTTAAYHGVSISPNEIVQHGLKCLAIYDVGSDILGVTKFIVKRWAEQLATSACWESNHLTDITSCTTKFRVTQNKFLFQWQVNHDYKFVNEGEFGTTPYVIDGCSINTSIGLHLSYFYEKIH